MSITADPENLILTLKNALATRESVFEAVEGAKLASVLVPLQFHDNKWHIILNVRSQHVGLHQGEIAFPGGKLESIDKDMFSCALRETWEEMGVLEKDINVLGNLDVVLTRTNYLVFPVVGTIPHPYQFDTESNEVAEIIEIPLDALLNEKALRHEARLNADGSVLRRVSFSYGKYLVFGATAWILNQFIEIIKSFNYTLMLEEQSDKRPSPIN
ncbi:MAG: CoA pyrophosphatase [SAR202 cluster bacterium]|nr:CoA pyrophosphatase [SAR202 cluster bacterium]|tara:strand:+ start:8842 stop:9483 length:642 start_codon:yes stop_codon:yes gene_type:complete